MKPQRRAEPRDGLARDPGRSGQAGRAADADAGADPRRERRALTVMFPFITGICRVPAGPQPCAARDSPRSSPGPPGARTSWKSARCWKPPASPMPRMPSFELADFISIGGNDLKQFFFAADRENELVRRRYDTLNLSFLAFWNRSSRAAPPSAPRFVLRRGCRPPDRGAGPCRHRPAHLSMRPASIGPVKALLRTGRSGRGPRRDRQGPRRRGGNRPARA